MTRQHAEEDCKTVRIFAYSSTREQSNKRSFSLLILRKKNRRFCSLMNPYTVNWIINFLFSR